MSCLVFMLYDFLYIPIPKTAIQTTTLGIIQALPLHHSFSSSQYSKPKVETGAVNNGHIRIEIPMSVDQGLGLFYDALGNFETVPSESKDARSIGPKSDVVEFCTT
jgi:hypothetical protein